MSVPVGLKAIETTYKGYRFRSRLEARWAVFFDALGVPWEYEKQGYDLGPNGWYLPDFWLPQQDCWIEIKPDRPGDTEGDRAAALAKATGQQVLIFWGPIPMPLDRMNLGQDDRDGAWSYWPEGWDNFYQWCECEQCGTLGIRFDGRSDRLPCKGCWECQHGQRCLHDPPRVDGCKSGGDKSYNVGSPKLIAAYTAARSARFEHGEAPFGRRAPVLPAPFNHRLSGWARKVYGDEWESTEDYDVVATRFEEWLEERGES